MSKESAALEELPLAQANMDSNLRSVSSISFSTLLCFTTCGVNEQKVNEMFEGDRMVHEENRTYKSLVGVNGRLGFLDLVHSLFSFRF